MSSAPLSFAAAITSRARLYPRHGSPLWSLHSSSLTLYSPRRFPCQSVQPHAGLELPTPVSLTNARRTADAGRETKSTARHARNHARERAEITIERGRREGCDACVRETLTDERTRLDDSCHGQSRERSRLRTRHEVWKGRFLEKSKGIHLDSPWTRRPHETTVLGEKKETSPDSKTLTLILIIYDAVTPPASGLIGFSQDTNVSSSMFVSPQGGHWYRSL